MTALTVFQVSDTHLSRTHGYFQDNWDVFVETVEAERPDIVFVTGDMCFNGPVNPDDLAYARSQMDRLSVPWRAIPGNHDIGDVPPDAKLKHPIEPERQRRYREHFGDEFWVEDMANWRFIGLNAQLMGSGLVDEDRQSSMLGDALSGAATRNIAILVHKPLFHAGPDETAETPATILPKPRAALLDLCTRHSVKLVACGHRHCYHHSRIGETELVWAPATAFIDTGKADGGIDLVRRAGFIRYRFNGATFTHELVEPPRFVSHDMRNWMAKAGSTTKLPPRPIASA